MAYPPEHLLPVLSSRVNISTIDPTLETQLPNGIIVYGKPKVMTLFKDMTEEFSLVWQSQSFVNIPFKYCMTILLLDNWQSKLIDIKLIVYPVGHKLQLLIENTFDEL